jgi:DNA-binding LacI/PurR family transcriptional regulator
LTITVRDIAERACVSTSTVSRVLNNYPFVAESTREVVLRAARELDYHLDNLRKPTQATKTLTIVLITKQADALQTAEGARNNTDYELIQGAMGVLSQQGCATHIYHTDMEPEKALKYCQSLHADGVMLLGGLYTREYVRGLQEGGLRLVMAGSHALPLHINCVLADIPNAMEAVLAHLVQLGRRTIGLVNGPGTTRTSEEKYKGLRLGLTLHDLPFSQQQVLSGDFTSAAGYALTTQMCSQVPALDALIYGDDQMAMGGLRALRELGKQVPGDIAVIGFHDYEIARFTDPPLTSVRFDIPAMGASAAHRLLSIIQQPILLDPWMVLMPTELILRGSSLAGEQAERVFHISETN